MEKVLLEYFVDQLSKNKNDIRDFKQIIKESGESVQNQVLFTKNQLLTIIFKNLFELLGFIEKYLGYP